VMDNHDIDTIIEPPAAGLTSYRQAVSEALARARLAPSWDTDDAGQLPSDPPWAGPSRLLGRWTAKAG